MGLLDGMVIVDGEGAVLEVNLGRPIVTDGDFFCIIVRERRTKRLQGGLVFHR